MSRFSNWLGQEASRRAGKAAADAVWEQENGASAYRLLGKILTGCGVGWLLLSFIPIACKEPISNCTWMWILAVIQIIPGTTFVVLSKKSKRFQEWAAKSFRKSLKKKENLTGKIQIGNVTLPMTRGDVLALKILGITAIILIAIWGIGCLQG